MQTVLTILIVLAMIGALVALIRGIIAFLKTTEADLKAGTTGPSGSAQRQNRMMFQRVGFQAAAVLLAVVLLALTRQG
ncbi:MAG: twin transmembrane helix small protein [Sphingomonadaceae bacterium]